jgi:hypothetical protein
LSLIGKGGEFVGFLPQRLIHDLTVDPVQLTRQPKRRLIQRWLDDQIPSFERKLLMGGGDFPPSFNQTPQPTQRILVGRFYQQVGRGAGGGQFHQMWCPIQPQPARSELLSDPPVIGVGESHEPVGGLTGHIQPGSHPILHPPIRIGQKHLMLVQLGEDLDLAGAELADLCFGLDQFGSEGVDSLRQVTEHTFYYDLYVGQKQPPSPPNNAKFLRTRHPYSALVLLNDFLPEWDVDERHEVLAPIPPDRAYQAVKELDLSRSRLIRTLFAVRGLPRGNSLTFERLTDVGFVVLAEDPPTEIVLGLIGQFWKMRGGLKTFEAAEFVSFADPGFVKAAWNFHVAPTEGGSTVSTETRVAATDDTSRRAFSRYWFFIGPFSGLIRREALRLIRRG